MRKRSRKPTRLEDVNQIAARIVRESTEGPDLSDEEQRKALARALGRLGGLKGGKARAAKLSKAERSAGASKAARARWIKEKQNQP